MPHGKMTKIATRDTWKDIESWNSEAAQSPLL